MVTNGPKKFAGTLIDEVFFVKKMYGHFARQPKKVAVIRR